MLPVDIGMGPAFAPPTLDCFAQGLPVGRQLRGISSTGRTFSPASGDGFQLGGGYASPAAQAMQTTVQEAHTDMVAHASQCMASASSDDAAALQGGLGGLHLIDSAQARAMNAIFRHADDPSQAEEVYAAGRYAARMGVEDLAVALSELRVHGAAAEECDRLEKSLCKMLIEDGLGDRSGFSAWYAGNCYDKVQRLTVAINAGLDALPGKPDIFEAAMQREVMPAIHHYLEARFGKLSYATWQKIDAAGGLISRAAAEAADRMTQSLRNTDQGGGAGALRAKVNQWRMAQHWAELMRGARPAPETAPQTAPAPPAESNVTPVATPASTHQATSSAPAPYSVKQESNPVFKPIIVIGSRDVEGTLTPILEERGNDIDIAPAGQNDNSPPSQPADEPPPSRGRSGAASPEEDMPDSSQGTAEMEDRLSGSDPVLQSRPSVQASRIDIPVPPPLPQSGWTSYPSPVAGMTSPTSPSTSLASPASVTSSLEETGTDQAVTPHDLRSRSLSPVQQLSKKFEDAGIGVQAPVKSSEHVGNRIITTAWPLLRSVSDGGMATARTGSRDSLVTSSEDGASPRPDYARLASGGSMTSPYQRLSTSSRTIQVGPAFSNVSERR